MLVGAMLVGTIRVAPVLVAAVLTGFALVDFVLFAQALRSNNSTTTACYLADVIGTVLPAQASRLSVGAAVCY
jgi:hypothetical protein